MKRLVAEATEAGAIGHSSTSRLVDDNSLSNGVLLPLDEGALGKKAPDVIEELNQGDPIVWTRGRENNIRIAGAHLVEDEIDIVIDRFRKALL